eukprot:764526-Hanusia_phi.AAC.3
MELLERLHLEDVCDNMSERSTNTTYDVDRNTPVAQSCFTRGNVCYFSFALIGFKTPCPMLTEMRSAGYRSRHYVKAEVGYSIPGKGAPQLLRSEFFAL